jgi:hypothetical protein
MLGWHLVLVTIYLGLQLVLSKTIELVTLNITFSVAPLPHKLHHLPYPTNSSAFLTRHRNLPGSTKVFRIPGTSSRTKQVTSSRVTLIYPPQLMVMKKPVIVHHECTSAVTSRVIRWYPWVPWSRVPVPLVRGSSLASPSSESGGSVSLLLFCVSHLVGNLQLWPAILPTPSPNKPSLHSNFIVLDRRFCRTEPQRYTLGDRAEAQGSFHHLSKHS